MFTRRKLLHISAAKVNQADILNPYRHLSTIKYCSTVYQKKLYFFFNYKQSGIIILPVLYIDIFRSI